MENKQQTALQEFIAWGDDMLLNHPAKLLSFGEAIDKAVSLLAKEKEQIMKAVDRGFDEGCKFPEDISLSNSEQYYNETYGE